MNPPPDARPVTTEPEPSPIAPAASPTWRARAARFLRRLGPTGPMAVAAVALPLVGAAVLLGSLAVIAPKVRDHPLGPVICAAVFAVCGGLALLPTAALSVFAGYVFKFRVGYPTALLGFAGATVLAYALARRASGARVVDLIAEHPRWRAVHAALLGGGFWRTFGIVALLRLPTFPPFAATTVFLAAVKVRRLPFFLGTVAGIAPRTAVYVYLAAKAEGLDFHTGGDVWLLALSAAALLAAIAVLTLIARRALAKITDGAGATAAPSVTDAPPAPAVPPTGE